MPESQFLCIGGKSDGDKVVITHDGEMSLFGWTGRDGEKYRVYSDPLGCRSGVLVPESASDAAVTTLLESKLSWYRRPRSDD